MIKNNNISTVLVAPLDWGLGHATRCIPIIKALLSNGYTVLLGATDNTAALLQHEFPELPILPLRGYKIKYANNYKWLPLKIFIQIPKILWCIYKEHQWLQQIIKNKQIHLVVSDNRYGLFSSKIPSVFITHQLIIKMPFGWLQKLIQQFNYTFINQFTQCWVPDVEGENNVAGILSHPKKMPTIPVHYLGIVSRFTKNNNQALLYKYCIVLSGPEPQRTILENIILANLKIITDKVVVIRGLPNSIASIESTIHCTFYNHLSTSALNNILQSSEYIISRSGYTTVMDILWLQKKSILIATPLQTEQEYLAQKLWQQQWCFSVSQQQFNLLTATKSASNFNYQLPQIIPQTLTQTINNLVSLLQQ